MKNLNTRLTIEEWNKLYSLADSVGLSIADITRTMIKSCLDISPDIFKKYIKALEYEIKREAEKEMESKTDSD